MEYLKCPVCGADLHLIVYISGGDWETEAGMNSDYNYALSLICRNKRCDKVYKLGHLKNENDFSPLKDKYKVYKK